MTSIAVIIPYFQREGGILVKALSSIRQQSFPIENIEVFIIDDGSPWPARKELNESWPHEDLQVSILEQDNSGPNEARNLGLEHIVNKGFDYIAYLDSDDAWVPEHLERGVAALGRGFSVYFANLIHLGHEGSTYEESGTLDIDLHPVIGDDESIRQYTGNMSNQIVTNNIMFIPSMIVDKASLGHVRFPMAHRHGGGDYLYWLALTAAGAKYAFSTEPEVKCGRGINMWYGSDWGTDGLAKRIMDEARFRRRALREYITDTEVVDHLKDRLTELQVVYLLDMAHRIRRSKAIDWKTFVTFWKEQPPGFRLIKALLGKLKKQAEE